MEFRKVLVLSSVLALAAFAQGCGNACDDFADASKAKLDECKITTPADGASDGVEAECTDAAATLAECLTPCIEAVSCDGLAGKDADNAKAYLDCQAACVK